MNGVHDMGGMQDMGPIQYEKNEPVFHARWEGRVYALSRSMRAWRRWTLDTDRHAIELLPPADYFQMSYYERWLDRLVAHAVRYGLVSKEEIETGRPAPGSAKSTPALTAAMTSRFLTRSLPSSEDPGVRPLFTVGERVRARNINPTGHTRLPRYARGRTGTIVRDHGVYGFPDTIAHFLGERRQHVYSVRFTAVELWGENAEPRHFVYIDMWDEYLERA